MRILQGSCKELFKDLPKIFIRILKDPQGSYKVLRKILVDPIKDLCQDP